MSQVESPQIKALKERYKVSFTEKVELLNQQRDIFADGNPSSEQLVELHQQLHKLAGSSGMYGYLDINVLCREIMGKIDASNVADLVKQINKLTLLLEDHS